MGSTIPLSPQEQKVWKEDKPYVQPEVLDLKWDFPLLETIRWYYKKEITEWKGAASTDNRALIEFLYHIALKNQYEDEEKYVKYIGALPWNSKAWRKVYNKRRVTGFQIAQISTVSILSQLGNDDMKHLMVSEVYNKKHPVPKNKWKLQVLQEDRKIDAASPSIKREIQVGAVEMGCMDAAQVLVLNGYRTMMLNFANETSPAGVHWGRGSEGGTQEEDIFKRTTVLASLWHHRNQEIDHDPYWGGIPDRWNKKYEAYYPIDGPEDAIYSPNVIYFRRNRNHNYELLPLKEQVTIAVVTAAAPINYRRGQRVTSMNLKTVLKEDLYKTFRHKIRTVYRIAATKKIDALVLGAWGCGAFGNNPLAVATLFKEVLKEKEFDGVGFKRVVFAVIGDRQSVGNVVAPFIKVFGEVDLETMKPKRFELGLPEINELSSENI